MANYTRTFVLDAGATGLTLTAQLVNTAGTNVGSAITTGFDEIGGGLYQWTATAIPDGHRGRVEFTDSGTIVAANAINPEEAELIGDLDAAVDANGLAVTVVAPVAENLDLTLIKGDDYNNGDTGREVYWPNPAGTWPDLTGATITFGAGHARTASVLQKTGTVVTPTGANQKVRVNFAAADTDDLSAETYRYDVQATLSNGRIVTLARGRLFLVEDYAE